MSGKDSLERSSARILLSRFMFFKWRCKQHAGIESSLSSGIWGGERKSGFTCSFCKESGNLIFKGRFKSVGVAASVAGECYHPAAGKRADPCNDRDGAVGGHRGSGGSRPKYMTGMGDCGACKAREHQQHLGLKDA